MYKTKSPHFKLEKIILRAHLLFQGFRTTLIIMNIEIENGYHDEMK